MPKANRPFWTSLLLVLGLFSPMLGLPADSAPLQGTVTGKVQVQNTKRPDASNIVVWLDAPGSRSRRLPTHPMLRQKGKRFSARVLVVPVGQEVDFPNDDPFPHNIFSNSPVKSFDLGLYQAGESRTVVFNRPGIVPVYCNIHPAMKSFIVVVKSPFFAVTNAAGDFQIPDVPPGTYQLRIWHERSQQSLLDGLSRSVTIRSGTANLGTVTVDESGYIDIQHKNKYGQPYQ